MPERLAVVDSNLSIFLENGDGNRRGMALGIAARYDAEAASDGESRSDSPRRWLA